MRTPQTLTTWTKSAWMRTKAPRVTGGDPKGPEPGSSLDPALRKGKDPRRWAGQTRGNGDAWRDRRAPRSSRGGKYLTRSTEPGGQQGNRSGVGWVCPTRTGERPQGPTSWNKQKPDGTSTRPMRLHAKEGIPHRTLPQLGSCVLLIPPRNHWKRDHPVVQPAFAVGGHAATGGATDHAVGTTGIPIPHGIRELERFG
eukprot:scaffold752_cov322-Pavlova_lutheri.AAC.3